MINEEGQYCFVKVEDEHHNGSSPSRKSNAFDQQKNPLQQNTSSSTPQKFEVPKVGDDLNHNITDSIEKTIRFESISSNDLIVVRKQNSDFFGLDDKSPMIQFDEKQVSCHDISTIGWGYDSLHLPICATTSLDGKRISVNHNNFTVTNSSLCPISVFEIEPDNKSNQIKDHSNGIARQHHHYHDSNNMPPLCSNSITTPNLSIQFSPFLTFSDERISNNSTIGNQQSDVALSLHTVGKTDGNRTKCRASSMHISAENEALSSSPLNSQFSSVAMNSNSKLTYADNLLFLNAINDRNVISTPTQATLATPKVSERKRKINHSSRASRQPQKRFSIDLERNEIPGGDLFVSKRDGRTRLTTNVPRKVEVIDPETGLRTRLYESCSEASRVMGINRTRISRTCRGGGGQIGHLIYKYVDMSEENPEERL